MFHTNICLLLVLVVILIVIKYAKSNLIIDWFTNLCQFLDAMFLSDCSNFVSLWFAVHHIPRTSENLFFFYYTNKYFNDYLKGWNPKFISEIEGNYIQVLQTNILTLSFPPPPQSENPHFSLHAKLNTP